MKAITHRHQWSSGTTEEQEKSALFGTLLFEADESESYEVETAELFKANDGSYNLLEANGCSCWDGDYEGWNMTLAELLDWATAKVGKQSSTRRKYADEVVAHWVADNILPLGKAGDRG